MNREEETSLTKEWTRKEWTRKEWTRKVVNVMQAYLDGKEIEERCGLGDWHDCPLPRWDWIENDYRIKIEE